LTTLHISHQSIELARCANLEILTIVPMMFECFGASACGTPCPSAVVRALEMYQQGLEALGTEVEAETLDEMIRAHGEISEELQRAARAAEVPAELIEQFAVVFREFESGLRRDLR